ncbi:hypothetical protein E2P81_ATG01767 [Venturia nashicola]|nr:hypothetical protein E2P81_ATG01767 [Venturia nashicola]
MYVDKEGCLGTTIESMSRPWAPDPPPAWFVKVLLTTSKKASCPLKDAYLVILQYPIVRPELASPKKRVRYSLQRICMEFAAGPVSLFAKSVNRRSYLKSVRRASILTGQVPALALNGGNLMTSSILTTILSAGVDTRGDNPGAPLILQISREPPGFCRHPSPSGYCISTRQGRDSLEDRGRTLDWPSCVTFQQPPRLLTRSLQDPTQHPKLDL